MKNSLGRRKQLGKIVFCIYCIVFFLNKSSSLDFFLRHSVSSLEAEASRGWGVGDGGGGGGISVNMYRA